MANQRTLRALLVGIDDYAPPVRALRGCGKDIEAVERLLRRRAADSGDRLDPVVLRDRQATRQAVIDAFRSHLGAAGPDDTALFYYSGHGSQERTTVPAHLAVEPDGLNETLVLADSRHGGVRDLADKELAQLVAEVSGSAGHVVLCLDCCHAGSGVRAADEDGIGVRFTPTDERPRSADSYLTGAQDTATTRYVLMAACRPDQTAKEVRVDGDPRGAFSVALERALGGIGGAAAPSYADLGRWAAAAVRNLATDQSPVVECPTRADAQLPFLGGLAAPAAPTTTASHVRKRGWVLDAGRLQGIAPGTADAPAAVALHPLGAPAPTASTAPLTTAEIVDVGATSSVLAPADAAALDEAATYRAVVTGVGQPQASVVVHGANDVAAEIRAALRGSAVVQLVDGDTADLAVSCDDTAVRVTRPEATRLLTAAEPAAAPGTVDRIVATVEHVGRWIGLRQRQNPASRLRPDDVALTVHDADGIPLEAVDGTVEVSYTRDDDGTERQPTVKIRYANASRRPLHCAVLALTELYGVACLTPGDSVRLAPGQESWVLDEADEPAVRTDVPDGWDRTTDLLKLLVSTEPFDAAALQQAPLVLPEPSRGPELEEGERGFDTRPATPAAGPDWATREVLVTTVRPGAWVPMPQPGSAPRDLGAGVALLPHAGLAAADARLSTRPTATRDATVGLLPPVLTDPEVDTEPFTFDDVAGTGRGRSVLEIKGASDTAAVTRDDPLRLRVRRPLGPDDLVLPVAFDGEDYLPLGHAVGVDGATELRLDRLPAENDLTARSVGGSVKILFRKLVLRRLGAEYPYPLLSLVTFPDAGPPCYVHDRDAVRAAVRSARRIALVVHGILGDTRGLAAGLQVGPTPLHAGYDAVLALDYENINTPVTTTAADLAQRLADVGVGADRRIDVVAHSMGGLVARCWIEQEGGAGAVRRLVTCGTPHAGSPWPRVQDVATAALALGLNGFGDLVGHTLSFLVRGVEGVDDALDAMQPGSPVLDRLATATQPPGVDYVAITGDRPFGVVGDDNRAQRILRKLRLPDGVVRLLFDGAPNDVAVSVDSASAVGRGWSPAPRVVDADCSHVTYFSSRAGLAALRTALAG